MAKHIKYDELTKSNVWTLNESDIYQILNEGKKSENWDEDKPHVMNIIRPVFDVVCFDRSNETLLSEYEGKNYDIFSLGVEGTKNTLAIKKRQIKKVTDLNLENVAHLLPSDVLKLIEENMGTGWRGLPLSIQDVIESAFYVDCSVMPAYALHRKGGLIERRSMDGYEVLELARGSWIEAIFIKAKPKVEKTRYSSSFTEPSGRNSGDDDEDLDEEEDDDMMDDDELPDDERLDEDDDEMIDEDDESNIKLENIDDIDDEVFDDSDEE